MRSTRAFGFRARGPASVRGLRGLARATVAARRAEARASVGGAAIRLRGQVESSSVAVPSDAESATPSSRATARCTGTCGTANPTSRPPKRGAMRARPRDAAAHARRRQPSTVHLITCFYRLRPSAQRPPQSSSSSTSASSRARAGTSVCARPRVPSPAPRRSSQRPPVPLPHQGLFSSEHPRRRSAAGTVESRSGPSMRSRAIIAIAWCESRRMTQPLPCNRRTHVMLRASRLTPSERSP